MCYMTDSSKNTGAKNYSASRKWLYKYPTDSIYLLDKIATVVANLLVEQAKAGAQLLMLFESHAELLNHSLYTRFIMKSLTKITTIVKESCNVPMIYFAKGGHYLINDLLESSFDVIGIDWTLDPAHIKVSDKTLMGNLDPAALYGDDDHIVSEVEKILEKFKGHRHIFNLGHGIYPDTDHKAVKTLVAKLRDYKI
ncbi:hypothetical protein HZS_7706 [Henneguya salminicola]|nr:hypothetical protein HZS_7706 [Henneguya salminicola]